MRPVCPAAKSLIQSFETCRLTAYPDGGGVWSIGWGHTGSEIHEGLTWTQELADQIFDSDVAAFGRYVTHYVPAELSDNEFGALVSFAYNCGLVALEKLGVFLHAGQRDAALTFWETFVHDRLGNIENGLVKRRRAEIALFKKP